MFEVTCTDPKKGEVKYTVSPFIFTHEALALFWKKSSKYPVLFNAEIREDFKKFAELFVGRNSSGHIFSKGLVWRIDTEVEELVGVFYMMDIELPHEATVHFSFLDGRIRGRIPLAKEMLKYVFDKYNFTRLNAELPAYVRPSAKTFVKELGFSIEGKKRKAAEFDNRMWDVITYGILKEEVLNGSQN